MNDILHLSIKAKNNKATLCVPSWLAENTPCIGVETDDQVDEAFFFKTLQCLSRFFLKHCTITSLRIVDPHVRRHAATGAGKDLFAGIGLKA